MTLDGGHGGNTDLEMRTVLFSYQKQPFPLGSKYRKVQSRLSDLDDNLKQVDLAPIGAALTKTPVPFSNTGFLHPAFAPVSTLEEALDHMRGNIE